MDEAHAIKAATIVVYADFVHIMQTPLLKVDIADQPSNTDASSGLAQWVSALIPVLAGLVSMQPLLATGLSRLPRGADSLLHFYRVVALDALIQQGVWFSRWFPNLAFGYGYPIFQYYPPLPHYLAEGLHVLGLSVTTALLLVFVIGAVIGATGVYQWVRQCFGLDAAALAAVAYAFAPYTLFNVFERAALAEFMALAGVPWVLGWLHRATVRGSWRAGLFAGLGYAAILLCHNITAMLVTPVIVAYTLLAMFWSRSSTSPAPLPFQMPERRVLRRRLYPVWALGLGLGLAAFFWLPAFLERDFTRLDAALSSAYHFSDYFLKTTAIFGWPNTIDPALINSQVEPSLSWPGILLAALGVSKGLFTKMPSTQRQFILFGAVITLMSILMTLPLSQPLWERIGLLRFVLYPSRFLGLASLFLAVLAGAGVAGLSKSRGPIPGRLPTAIACLAVLALCGYGAFWQIPLFHPANVSADAASIPAVERTLGIVGTTSIGEYTPSTVPAWPAQDAPTGSKLLTDTLPPGSHITRAAYAPLRYQLGVALPAPATLRFAQFYFQGWQAQVDGAMVALKPEVATGFMTLDVPAGPHEIEVWFGSTQLRIAATLISIFSLLTLLSVMVWTGYVQRIHPFAEPPAALPTSPFTPPNRQPLLAAGLGLVMLTGFFVAKEFWVDRTQNVWRTTRFDGATVAGLPAAAHVQFGDQLTLLGVEAALFNPAVRQAEVHLLWRVPQPSAQDYSIGLQILDANGQVISARDVPHPDLIYPTSRWQPNQYVRDVHRLAIPFATPPGVYQIRVGVYPIGQPAARLSAVGHIGDPIVGTLVLTRPVAPPTVNQAQPQQMLSTTVKQDVELIGIDLPLDHLQVGDILPLNLYWRAHQTPKAELQVCLSLRSDSGESTSLSCAELVSGFSTRHWQVDDLWRASYRAHVPPGVVGGQYALHAQLVDMSANAPLNSFESVPIGRLQIDAPARVMRVPRIEMPIHARWPGLVDLMGYAVAPSALEPGAPMTVTLVWQPLAEVASKYKVFVQLVDAQQNRVAGHDGTPAEGARPTTTWLAGEFITDVHILTVPADWVHTDLRLWIGFYDEFTLQRLPLEDGTDVLRLILAVSQ